MATNKKTNSSLDTIMNGEEKSKKPSKRQNYKCTDMKKKDTTQPNIVRTTDGHISQQIYVQKQELQCIINLNTTVCKHKSKHRKRRDRKYGPRHLDSECEEKPMFKCAGPESNVNKKDKIVPICFRQVCHNHTRCENKLHTQIIERSSVKKLYKEWNKATYIKDDEKYDYWRKSRYADHKCRQSRHKNKHNDIKVFPAPLQVFEVDNLSYEDISTSSIKTYVEKPKSYKRKHHKHKNSFSEAHESKLDTLIRRTKERERKLQEQSRDHKPWYTSTPINESSSAEFPMSNSDMDISFNSRSTLVLDTQSQFAYSPLCPIQDLHACSETEYNNGAYSPSSPIRNEDCTKDFQVPRNNDYILANIKNEPMMDIEPYTPISSPGGFSPQSRVEDKVKVKTEPIFSPKLSPISFEDNSGLHFCIKEFIKSEVADD